MRTFRIVLVLCLLALAVGCSSPRTGPRDSQGVIDDLSIQRDIAKGFLEAEVPNWNNIVIRSRNGVVTLEGALPTKEWIREAVDIADSVSGVRKVENRLRIGQR